MKVSSITSNINNSDCTNKNSTNKQEEKNNKLDYRYYRGYSLFADFCNITQVGNNLGSLDCILFLSYFY